MYGARARAVPLFLTIRALFSPTPNPLSAEKWGPHRGGRAPLPGSNKSENKPIGKHSPNTFSTQQVLPTRKKVSRLHGLPAVTPLAEFSVTQYRNKNVSYSHWLGVWIFVFVLTASRHEFFSAKTFQHNICALKNLWIKHMYLCSYLLCKIIRATLTGKFCLAGGVVTLWGLWDWPGMEHGWALITKLPGNSHNMDILKCWMKDEVMFFNVLLLCRLPSSLIRHLKAERCL